MSLSQKDGCIFRKQFVVSTTTKGFQPSIKRMSTCLLSTYPNHFSYHQMFVPYRSVFLADIHQVVGRFKSPRPCNRSSMLKWISNFNPFLAFWHHNIFENSFTLWYSSMPIYANRKSPFPWMCVFSSKTYHLRNFPASHLRFSKTNQKLRFSVAYKNSVGARRQAWRAVPGYYQQTNRVLIIQ